MKTTFIFYSFFFISWPSPLSSLSSLFLPDLAQLIYLYLSLSQCLSFLYLSLSLSLSLPASLSLPLSLSLFVSIFIYIYNDSTEFMSFIMGNEVERKVDEVHAGAVEEATAVLTQCLEERCSVRAVQPGMVYFLFIF